MNPLEINEKLSNNQKGFIPACKLPQFTDKTIKGVLINEKKILRKRRQYVESSRAGSIQRGAHLGNCSLGI